MALTNQQSAAREEGRSASHLTQEKELHGRMMIRHPHGKECDTLIPALTAHIANPSTRLTAGAFVGQGEYLHQGAYA